MDGNFYIYTDLSALPVDEHEAYLAEGFGGVCTGGVRVPCVVAVAFVIIHCSESTLRSGRLRRSYA